MKTRSLSKRILSMILTLVTLFTFSPMSGFIGEMEAWAAASNEETIYQYLKNNLGLNTAQACGVLANIKNESGFNPTAHCIDTNNKTSYGICQWNGGRFDALRNYCSNNGYDYKSLNGQLHYLEYELNHSENAAYKGVKAFENTREGAYNAGYYWAQRFERCASQYYAGRGELARNYWDQHKNDNNNNNKNNNNNAVTYKPRLTAPDFNDKHFKSDNIFYQSNPIYGMPNCTCYAWGRVYEIRGSKPDLPTGNAGTWFSVNKQKYDSGKGGFPYSTDITKPQLGAVVVWSCDGGAGHVAVVESINGSSIVTSESGYNEWKSTACNSYFWTQNRSTTSANLNSGSAYHFLGYIYTGNYVSGGGNNGGGGTTTYTKGVYRINTAAGVNFRDGASINAARIGGVANGTELEITEISGSWGKTVHNGKTGWVCLDYAVYVRKLDEIRKPDNPAPKLSTAADVALGAVNTVTWGAAANATGYNVKVKGEDGTVVVEQKGVKGTSTSFTISKAGTYTVFVSSTNSKYTSDAVAVATKINVHANSNVIFQNDDGKELFRQSVPYGGSATAPTAPSKRGFTFTGWKGIYTNVKQDVTIVATYIRNKYTVNFFDEKGQLLDTQRVEFESGATAPKAPALTDYEFSAWDKKFDRIEGDTDVYPVYTWANADLPISISDVSAVRDSEGYNVTFTLNNSPNGAKTARLVVALKTAEGKLIETTESAAYYLREGATRKDSIYVASKSAASIVEVYAVEKFAVVVPIAQPKKSTVTGDAYTEWSVKEPAADVKGLQSQNEYRYQTITYKNSTTKLAAPWILVSETSGYSDYGAWSEWTTNYIASSDTRQVETKTETKSNVTGYNMVYYLTQGANSPYYRHYREYSISNNLSGYGARISYGEHVNRRTASVSDINNARKIAPGEFFEGGSRGYNKGNATAYALPGDTNTPWFIESEIKENYNVTYYRYRDRTDLTNYRYKQYSEWSNWSTQAQTESDTKHVESRKVYRYIASDTATIENTEGKARTIAGTVDKKYAGKNAVLFVYKIDSAADYTNEAVSQCVIGTDGSYSFSFKLREEPTSQVSAENRFKPTGDFTVTLGIEGNDSVIYLDPILAPVPSHVVQFVDYDGKEISTVEVKDGEDAPMPKTAPERRGYTFVGYDESATNVTSDLVLTAKYIKNTYTVVFIDWMNKTAVPKTYSYGDPILPPEVTAPEGYNFLGFDGILNGKSTVTDNAVLFAVYEEKTCEVSFVDYDGKVISTQNVKYGNAAELPADPKDDGVRCFLGWDSNIDCAHITYSCVVHPQFCYYNSADTPAANLKAGVYTAQQTVTLTAGKDARIYYTIDGTDPALSGQLYTKPITLTKSCNLIAYAAEDGKNNSPYLTVSYAINTGNVLSDYMSYKELPAFVQKNAAAYNVTAATGYRYLMEETVTSKSQMNSLLASGWEIKDEKWSDWSEWGTSFANTGDLVIEEKSKDQEPVDMDFFRYKHWKYYDEKTSSYQYTYEEIEGIKGEWETIDTPEKLPVDTFVDGVSSYAYNGQKWFGQTAIVKSVIPDGKLYQYRYKTMTMTKPSAWVEKLPAGKTAVDTGEVYCYTEPDRGILTIVDPKGAQLYQDLTNLNEPAMLNLEDLKQNGAEIKGFKKANGESFDIEKDIVTESITLTLVSELNQFTVRFLDDDGTELSTQQVAWESSAIPPSMTETGEKLFVGWDNYDFTNVTKDMDITAKYFDDSNLSLLGVSTSKCYLSAGSSFHLSADLSELSVKNPDLIWRSLDPTVADVGEDGDIVALKSGETDVIVTEQKSGTMAICTVQVDGTPDNEICVNANSGLSISDDILTGISLTDNTVASVLSKFRNGNLSVIGADGKAVASTGLVGTGCQIVLKGSDGTILDKITVAVQGDINGDGKLTLADAVKVLRCASGTLTLTATETKAADVDNDGYVGVMDADQIASYLVGKGPFYNRLH